MPDPALSALISELVGRYGEAHRGDIERGVLAGRRVLAGGDAEFAAFCRRQYLPPGVDRDALLHRLDAFVHLAAGAMEVVGKAARAGIDIADLSLTPAEEVLGRFSVGTHLSEDLRRSHLAALIQLNFGTNATDPPATRDGWAARRLANVGREVIPADLLSRMAAAAAEANTFISRYNLYLENLDFGDPLVQFPPGTRLISHWGLRDYLVSLNGKPHALPKQRAILDLLRRVVDGEIPAEVLDNPSARWNLREDFVETDGRRVPAVGHGPLRWEVFRRLFQIRRQIDPHTRYGNLIDEAFRQRREMPESQVVEMLEAILSAPQAAGVVKVISRLLRRPPEVFDIYFEDFQGFGLRSPLAFDLGARYPNAKALTEAIPSILVTLGWAEDRARRIGSHIRVDNARASGHASRPATDTDQQLLRVRVGPGGISELEFSTFMHELGHCVEGVLSSYEMDFKGLWGVPNSAIGEGFAFTFEVHADEILGRHAWRDPALDALGCFWETFEVAGPALTEIRFFHWLYEHPEATAEEMQRAVRSLGDEVWGQYYARLFGAEGFGLMAAYSHMLTCSLYLPEYPLGHAISYQIHRFLRGRDMAMEMGRMCRLGKLYPDSWMREAVGGEISVEPLLVEAAAALRWLGG